ncbi:MAG: DUF3039 domain-containing protein [Bifidobacteriaceae bacterium]|jgi:hypothetical protein|nr:DUF3039 domain-containing protein [Bifidobacteriaceae bacterium]
MTPSSPEPPVPPAAPSRETGAGLGTETLTRGETRASEGDHERFAHYVKKDRLVPSAITGKPVVALCGKVWVPSRDPSRFPVCPICKEILAQLPT